MIHFSDCTDFLLYITAEHFVGSATLFKLMARQHLVFILPADIELQSFKIYYGDNKTQKALC